jgi:hypothetical protein
VAAHLQYGQYNTEAVNFAVARVQGTPTPSGTGGGGGSGSPAPTTRPGAGTTGGVAAARPVTVTPRFTG